MTHGGTPPAQRAPALSKGAGGSALSDGPVNGGLVDVTLDATPWGSFVREGRVEESFPCDEEDEKSGAAFDIMLSKIELLEAHFQTIRRCVHEEKKKKRMEPNGIEPLTS